MKILHKHITSGLVVGFLVVGFFSAHHALAATLKLSPTSGTIANGSTITVDILLDTAGAAVDGVDVYSLHYNPSILQVQDASSTTSGVQITAGTLLPLTLTNTVNTTNGLIQFSQVTTGGTTYTGSGKLATITFKGIAGGTSAVTFDFTAGSTSDSNVAGAGADKLTAVTNGSYTVTGGPTPAPTATPLATMTPVPTASKTPTPTAIPVTSTTPAPVSTTTTTTTSSTALVRFQGDSKVYQVVNKNEIKWIPTLEVFNQLGLSWNQVTVKPASQKSNYTRAKLIQAEGDSHIYYVTEGGLKRWVLNSTVFFSYNDKYEDVVTVTPAEVAAIPDSVLVHVPGDPKIYKLEEENGSITKRWITTGDVFTRNGYDWAKVAPVNEIELNAYALGTSIQ